MNPKKLLLLPLALAAAMALSACNDGGSTPPPTTEVPGDADRSVANFMKYVKDLVSSTDTDTLEPVDVSGVTPPTDDTIEPETVE